MKELVEYILAVAGLTYMITRTSIFKGLREYLSGSRFKMMRSVGSIISCPACFGFWAALILFGLHYEFIYYPLIGFVGVVLIMKYLQ